MCVVSCETMEPWRIKLIEALPSLRSEWEDPDETVYSAFMELNAKCRGAHDRDDQPTLSAIYEFAAWCSRQEEKDLWNAAGVSFYEHIIDHPIALQEFPRWVAPDVFHKISGLLQWRMGEEAFSELSARYGRDRLKSS